MKALCYVVHIRPGLLIHQHSYRIIIFIFSHRYRRYGRYIERKENKLRPNRLTTITNIYAVVLYHRNTENMKICMANNVDYDH